MRNLCWKVIHQGGGRMLLSMLFGLVILATVGCDSDDQDAVIINDLLLPTDLVLGLRCAEVGINTEPCVLEDRSNPYRTATIIEFSNQDPDDLEPPFENKFDLNDAAPGPKAKFYLWATALAKQPSGENQYYTARALHELWDEQVTAGFGDPIIQEQAIKAYRAVLDHFIDEATFFTTCDFAPCPPNDEFLYAVQVKDLTGQALVVSPDFVNLFPGPAPFPASFDGLDTMGSWGFGYELPNPGDPADNGTTFSF